MLTYKPAHVTCIPSKFLEVRTCRMQKQQADGKAKMAMKGSKREAE